MADTVEEIFVLLKQDAKGWVEKAKVAETMESETLDFKQWSDNHNNNQRAWGEALSGFANNAGGIIVWGVDCRKTTNDEGIELDIITGLHPIPKPKEVVGKLKSYIPEYIDGPLTGIEVESQELSDGTGLVFCYVPKGEHPPYAFKNKGTYHLRVQDSFTRIPHSTLRLMFSPRLTPLIYPQVFWDADQKGGFALIVRNGGNGTAQSLIAHVMVSDGTELLTPAIKLVDGDVMKMWELPEAPMLLHPQSLRPFARFQKPPQSKQGWPAVVIAVEFHMLDQPPQCYRILLPKNYSTGYNADEGFEIKTAAQGFEDWKEIRGRQ